MLFPSGDQVGKNSPTEPSVNRRGTPESNVTTHTRSRAVNAQRKPSGDSRGCWIARTVKGSSEMGYSNRTSEPSFLLTCAVNRISVTFFVSISIRQILPLNAVTSARLSGVNEE